MSWIQVYGGRKFDPFSPKAEDLTIEMIAHALSNLCRFVGHTESFYSVAQHSAEMVLLARQFREPLDIQKWCLLHDAAEAFIGDIARPYKAGLGWFRHYDSITPPSFLPYESLESRILHVVAAKFELPLPIPSAVGDYDNRMLATEKRDVMGPGPEWDGFHFMPFARKLHPANPAAAEALFLATYREIFE